MLLQERYKGDPWRVLVCCILLNQTSRQQVDRAIDRGLFESYPDAKTMARTSPDKLYMDIWELGFGNRRARTLVNMSKRWLELKHPTEDEVRALPGVGPYALDSYRIFCLNDESKFESGDKEIKAYLDAKGA